MKRRFQINGNIYDIPDDLVSSFLSDNPKAVEVKSYTVKGQSYNIPLKETDAFETDMGLKKKDGGSVSAPTLQESSQNQKEVTSTQNINVGQGQQPTIPQIYFNKLNAQHGQIAPGTEQKNLVQYGANIGQEQLDKRNTAIDNSLQLKYQQQGKKVSKNSTQYRNDFNDMVAKLDNGDVAQTTAKDGKLFIVNTRGFLPSAGEALVNSFKTPIEAVKLMGKSDKELAEYFDEQQRNTPYLESKPSPVAGNLGEIVGGLPKIIGEFAIPIVGEGVAVADQMLSSTGQQTQALYQKKLSDLKQANPNYEPTPEDKAQIAGQARKDAPIEAIPDAAMIMLLKENGSDAGALNESAKTFSSVLKREVNKTANVALAGTGAGAFKTGAEKAQGYNVTMKDALDNMGKEGFSYATMQAVFSLAPIVSKMLTPSQAAWKSYMSKVPDAMVDEVTSKMPNGDEIKKDIQDFKTAGQTVPDHYSDEQKVALSHLIQKKNDLKENEDENFKEDNKPQIENIDKNIQAVKQNPDNALDLIPDESTGEHNANPKEFDELSKKEQQGIIVPKDYGEATTKEIGEGENKKYIPKATFTNKQGVIETNEPIKIEDAKEYGDKDKAQQSADNALAKHYYENGLQPIEKPQKEIKQTEIIQPKGVEGNTEGNEKATKSIVPYKEQPLDKPVEIKPPIKTSEVKGEYIPPFYGFDKPEDVLSLKRGDKIIFENNGRYYVAPLDQDAHISSDKTVGETDMRGKPTKINVIPRVRVAGLSKRMNEIFPLENLPEDEVKGVEGNQPINEPIPTIETGKESKDLGEVVQPTENKVSEPKEPTQPSILGSGIEKRLFDESGDLYKKIDKIKKDYPLTIDAAFKYTPKQLTDIKERFKPIVDEIKKATDGDKITLYRANQEGGNNRQLSSWTSKPFVAEAFSKMDKVDEYGVLSNLPERGIEKKEIPIDDIVAIKNTIYGEGFFTKDRSSQYEFLIENKPKQLEQSQKENINTQPINKTENAIREQSPNEMDVRQQTANGEGVGISNSQSKIPSESRIEQPKEENQNKGEEKNVNVHVQYPPTQLTHGGTERIREEHDINEPYHKQSKSTLRSEKEANDLIENGYDVNGLVDKIKNEQYVPNTAEHIVLTKYAAELQDRLRSIKNVLSSEYDQTLKELKRVADAADIGQSEKGRTLGVSSKFKTVADGSYGEFMLGELTANNDAPLTDNQKITAQSDWNKFNDAKAKFDEDKAKFDEEVTKFRAEQELAKTKKETASKSTKKKHDDLVKEREQIFTDIKDKLRKARGQASATIVPYANELIAIAPDVLKLARNLVEDGIVKLDEVVKNIHEKLKDEIEGISEKDIHNILAGDYNERKITKTEAAIQFENLKQQARLINNLESAKKGEPKTEKGKIKKNQDIEKFKKDLGIDELQQLESLAQRNKTEIQKIQEKIKKGDFAPEQKKQPLLEDKELAKRFPERYKAAKESRDALLKAKKDIQLRRLKQMYENKTPQEKFAIGLTKGLNVPRTLMASMDLSAPFRQGFVATVSHPFLSSKAAKFMLQAAKDHKVYDAWLDDVHNDPLWNTAEKSKLAVTDPETLHLKDKEEAFLGGNYAEAIPGVAASERAYVGFLNKLRWDLFKFYSDVFQSQGKTYDNNPELYKGLASFINSSTGRGGMAFGESASPFLSSIIFSPRLIAARLNMLGLSDIPNLLTRGLTFGKYGVNYGFYSKLPKEIRILAAKDMLKTVAVGLTTLALAKAASNVFGGNIQVEDDPRSADFGKIKSGDTRWDIWGGFLPYARVITQFITGQRKTEKAGVYDIESKYGQNRADVLGTFARSKLAPVPGALLDVAEGRTVTGDKVNRTFGNPFNNQPNEINLTNEVAQHLIPLIMQDVADAWKTQGAKSLFTVGVPSAVGIGVQTYQPRQSTAPKESSKFYKKEDSYYKKFYSK